MLNSNIAYISYALGLVAASLATSALLLRRASALRLRALLR